MRLSKVAKELNVGTANIVDHLASNGIKIDARPNTKITPDAYQLLKQEFNADVEQHKLSAEVSQARREEKEAIKAVAIKKSEYIIKANNTIQLISEIKDLYIKDDIIEQDGFINLSKANIVAINGLDGYALPSLKERIDYQRPKKINNKKY